MPELPDITVYVEKIEDVFRDQPLRTLRLRSPFLLRTIQPSLEDFQGRKLLGMSRRGKRLVFSFAGDMHLVLHLMVAGRLHLKPSGAPIPKSNGLLALDFENETLLLTESGTKKRASLHAIAGQENLAALFPIGLEVFDASSAEFTARLRRENHTLKRALTDPRLFSGIGNAYSDEILHQARLSPVLLTGKITDAQADQLYRATREVLREWTELLRREAGSGFPEKVTAFREGMAVHGRYGLPCPTCGTPVQRIRHAENETNYCPTCQTGGKLLADRALSTLLRKDWPRTLEEMEKLVSHSREVAAMNVQGALGTSR